jgi:LPXTG-motif cell wall-anchored protein
VTLTDHLPTGLTWAEDPNVAECTVTTATSQTLSCTWAEIAPSTTKTVSISGTTVTGNCPSISNTATVAARNETVANQADNSASATISVTCPQFFENPTTTTTQPPPTTTTQPPQVLPEVITTTTTAPTTTTTLAVLGVQLARTGDDTGIWLRLAGLFLVAGGLLLLAGDKRVWPAIRRQ